VSATASRIPSQRRGQRPGAVPARRVPDEKAYLYEIIQTISAGPDLSSVLHGIVRLVTEATKCHACFVYFVEGDHLALRAASTMYAHLEGVISFSLDEGLTGWVVRTRRSAFIRDKALEDPRMLYIPEMEEERFQSMVSVPVFSRAGDVIGVINLHTEAPREFARADLEFLEHTASLVAGAIENARLYENATKRVAMLTELSRLAQEIALAGSVSELLTTVTAGCQAAVGAEAVELYLLDADNRLVLRAATPARVDPPVIDVKKARRNPLTVDSRHSPAEEIQSLATVIWGDGRAGAPLFVPLVVGEDRPGILAALTAAASPDTLNLVSAVASHTAVALKHHELVGKLREDNLLKDFFEALSREDSSPEELSKLAVRLGVDLQSPHIVLHTVHWAGHPPASRRSRKTRRAVAPRILGWTDIATALESSLSGVLAGTVFDSRSTSCRAILAVPPGGERDLHEVVRRVYNRVSTDGGLFTIGLSNICRDAGSYPRAFAEAASAADVGALIKGAPGVYTYEDLGPYRYVLSAEDAIRDRHQEQLERLVEYDARRGSELLHTLDVFLEGRGNVVGTARVLHTHPNTLRQRLGRIEQLCGFNLEHEDWLSLSIAIKIVKLRLARSSARTDEEAQRD
jgi:sugar diacid utilization regulator/putative methionine-R-sulfoxide reductase with GAF domain